MRPEISTASLMPADPASYTAAEIRAMMRTARVTIRDVARANDLTLRRVREARAEGGPFDWPMIVIKSALFKARAIAPPTITTQGASHALHPARPQ